MIKGKDEPKILLCSMWRIWVLQASNCWYLKSLWMAKLVLILSYFLRDTVAWLCLTIKMKSAFESLGSTGKSPFLRNCSWAVLTANWLCLIHEPAHHCSWLPIKIMLLIYRFFFAISLRSHLFFGQKYIGPFTESVKDFLVQALTFFTLIPSHDTLRSWRPYWVFNLGFRRFSGRFGAFHAKSS